LDVSLQDRMVAENGRQRDVSVEDAWRQKGDPGDRQGDNEFLRRPEPVSDCHENLVSW
jgi:hypothetical protein